MKSEHFKAEGHVNPDIASEMVAHCLDDGSLFIEINGYGSWVNGESEYRAYNFSADVKQRLIELLKSSN